MAKELKNYLDEGLIKFDIWIQVNKFLAKVGNKIVRKNFKRSKNQQGRPQRRRFQRRNNQNKGKSRTGQK
jgi:hypothetical protein